MTIKIPKGMTECPNCNPINPALDEDGRPYTCYACGDTGWVPEGYDEELPVERERRDFASERSLEFREPWRYPSDEHDDGDRDWSTLDDGDVPFRQQ